jgi:hypothetical protein
MKPGKLLMGVAMLTSTACGREVELGAIPVEDASAGGTRGTVLDAAAAPTPPADAPCADCDASEPRDSSVAAFCAGKACGEPCTRDNGLPGYDECNGMGECATPLDQTCDGGVPSQCGGFAGLTCPPGYSCVDDPRDACRPDAGGVDCTGLCLIHH